MTHCDLHGFATFFRYMVTYMYLLKSKFYIQFFSHQETCHLSLDLGIPKVRLLIHNAAHVGAKGSFLDSELGAVGEMVVLNRWVACQLLGSL